MLRFVATDFRLISTISVYSRHLHATQTATRNLVPVENQPFCSQVKTSLDISFRTYHFRRMPYQYGQIEYALARACNIEGKEFGAFRAKLRHLRSLGVPKVEKVGSGSRARFSLSDAIVMRIALELSMLGVKPAAIAVTLDEVKPAAITKLINDGASSHQPEKDDFYFYITIGLVTSMFIHLPTVWELAALNTTASFAVVNISRLVREMVSALKG
jgi:hypothetical protein